MIFNLSRPSPARVLSHAVSVASSLFPSLTACKEQARRGSGGRSLSATNPIKRKWTTANSFPAVYFLTSILLGVKTTTNKAAIFRA